MTTWVYIKSEPALWTVGFYRPDGTWEPESDHPTSQAAAARTAWLNGAAPDNGSRLTHLRGATPS